jgi:hypothetical protein
MNDDLYKNSIEYEKLTQAIYQSILNDQGLEKIRVEHNVSLRGHSGVEHQIDVHWKFKSANIEHAVLIECKNYSSALTLEKVRNFHAILNDIGNCKGIMVTKVGYQRGARQYADFYGIELKLLRKPKEEDWQGKIKDIHLNIIAKAPKSTPDMPISISLFLSPDSDEQKTKIDRLQQEGKLNVPSGPDMCLLDKNAVPITEEMKWWLPKQLNMLDKEPGGPYEQCIEFKDKYILINPESDEEQLVKTIGMKVKYWVEELDTKEMIIHGSEIVKTILKDFSTNETEYVERNK